MNITITKKDKLVQRTFNIKDSQLKNIDELAIKYDTNCNEVMRSILDSQLEQKWIDINTSLPDEDELVLVYVCGSINSYSMGYYKQGHGVYNDFDLGADSQIFGLADIVTHWMHLPKTPNSK